VPASAWGGLVYSTLLSLVAAYILWSRAVHQIGASRAALYTCITPLIATAIAAAVLGERPTVWHLAGGLLIVSGVVLGNRRLAPTIPAEG
jgi:drug/metabolite transporter (DMT)-like permease